ncbi:MAG: TauD/TfdA family dioxygenase [Janthinobacterium lividum]
MKSPIDEVEEFPSAATQVGWLDEGRGRVLCFRPRGNVPLLAEWAESEAELIAEAVRRHGAVLFRGFRVDDVGEAANATQGFSRFIAATSRQWADYREPATPRSQVASNIFTSTEYPADQRIPLHNENSHCTSWPLKIYFHSIVPARVGGETPIADCRKVLARLPDGLVARFEARRWRYTRHFGSGLGFSWSKVFQTSDRDQVERYCCDNGMTYTWGRNDSLTVRYVRPAVRVHPLTGEAIWFNHGLFFNPMSIDPEIREMLLESFSREELPYDTSYGDGAPIDPADLQTIADAYAAEMRQFAWQVDDVLCVDNMLFAHGRSTFKGPRRVLVGMADSYVPEDGTR